MPAYDSSFDPPAPVAVVRVIHPVSGRSSERTRGKLDYGADITVTPERVVSQLRLTSKGHCWVKGFEGSRARKPVFYVRLRVDAFDIVMVRCVAAERDDVLLGRNVLNRFVITLDGGILSYEMRPV